MRTFLRIVFIYAAIYGLFFLPGFVQGRILAPGDAGLQFLPAYYASRTTWTPFLYSGFPFAAEPQNMYWYPLKMLGSMINGSWNAFVIVAYVFASSLMCVFVRRLTGYLTAGFASGLVYGMSGYMFGHFSHTGQIHGAAWLPLLFLALENAKTSRSAGWICLGAAAVALSFLAGHPQPFVYGFILAAIFVLCTGPKTQRWRYRGRAVLTLTLGLALCAIQIVPTAEFARLSARADLTFEYFSEYHLRGIHLLHLWIPQLFGGATESIYHVAPYAGWNSTEYYGYVGLLAIPCAILALGNREGRRQILFWAITALLSLMLSLGPETPLAHVTFRIPLVRLLRVPSRHLWEWCFAMSVLMGFGIARVISASPEERRRIARLGGLILCTSFAVAGTISWIYLMRTPDAPALPIVAALVAATVMVASILGLLVWANLLRRHPKTASVIFLATVFLDLGAANWWDYWRYDSPKASEYWNRPDAFTLRSAMFEGDRFFAPNLETPASVPLRNEALLWRMANAGGYGSLLERRYGRLLGIDADGSADTKVVIDGSNRVLDLLGVRFLIVPTGRLAQGPRGLPLRAEFALPPEPSSRIRFVTSLAHAHALPQASRLLDVKLELSNGSKVERTLTAGVDTAEWAWDRADIRSRVQHAKPQPFHTFAVLDNQGRSFDGHSYASEIPIPQNSQIAKIQLRYVGPEVGLTLHSIQLQNNSQWREIPLDLLEDPNWRIFHESPDVVVLERTGKRMPRAWIVRRVVLVDPAIALDAVRSGELFDREPFEPAQTALVETPLAISSSAQPVESRAEIVSETPTTVEVRAMGGGLLVLADPYYPGWTATVDDKPTQVLRVDYALRGAVVPPGRHTVRFRFEPLSIRFGAAVTMIAFVGIFGLLLSHRLGFGRGRTAACIPGVRP